MAEYFGDLGGGVTATSIKDHIRNFISKHYHKSLPQNGVGMRDELENSLRKKVGLSNLELAIDAVANGSGGFVDDGEVPSTSRGRPRKAAAKTVNPKPKPQPKGKVAPVKAKVNRKSTLNDEDSIEEIEIESENGQDDSDTDGQVVKKRQQKPQPRVKKGVSARVSKIARSFIDNEALEVNGYETESGEDGEEDDEEAEDGYDSDVAEAQLMVRAKKKPTRRINSDNEGDGDGNNHAQATSKKGRKRAGSATDGEADEGTSRPKKKIVKKKSTLIRLDLSGEAKTIPCLDCELGGNWHLKLQDFRGEKWIALRKFDGDVPGAGATLPFSYLPKLVKAINYLGQMVVEQTKKQA